MHILWHFPPIVVDHAHKCTSHIQQLFRLTLKEIKSINHSNENLWFNLSLFRTAAVLRRRKKTFYSFIYCHTSVFRRFPVYFRKKLVMMLGAVIKLTHHSIFEMIKIHSAFTHFINLKLLAFFWIRNS